MGIISDVLARIRQLRGVTWNWHDDEAVRVRGLMPGERRAGVIAQEVEAVFPQLVTEDAEGYKSVDYSGLVAVLIEAVKELDARLESLERADRQR